MFIERMKEGKMEGRGVVFFCLKVIVQFYGIVFQLVVWDFDKFNMNSLFVKLGVWWGGFLDFYYKYAIFLCFFVEVFQRKIRKVRFKGFICFFFSV